MDPIITRLERLERDYRRSRLWNRVSLLALLVAVCAGFAQQQDPKLPDVIKCKTLEAQEVLATGVVATMITSAHPSRSDKRRGDFMLTTTPEGAGLLLQTPDTQRRILLAVDPLVSQLRIEGGGRKGMEQNHPDHAVALRSDALGSRLSVQRAGRDRAVLGTISGTDKLGRDIHYPESTLTLLDKDGKFLEQLPR